MGLKRLPEAKIRKKKTRFLTFWPKIDPLAAQVPPRAAREAHGQLPRGQERHQGGARAAQDGPRSPQERPRSTQEAPRERQEGRRRLPGAPKRGPGDARAAPGGPKTLQKLLFL